MGIRISGGEVEELFENTNSAEHFLEQEAAEHLEGLTAMEMESGQELGFMISVKLLPLHLQKGETNEPTSVAQEESGPSDHKDGGTKDGNA